MNRASLSSLYVCAAALSLLLGCGDKDSADTGPTTSASTQAGDGDGDGGTGETSGNTTGDGDGSPTTTTTTGTGFVPDTDLPGASTCDPWAQDCPEDEKCVAWNSGGDTWDANKCVPLTGDGKTGEECVYDGSVLGTDNCDVGYMCYYTNQDGVGVCVPLCTGSPDDPMCEEQFNCSVSNDGSLLLCLYACDPLLQDCEQEGAGCFWDGAQFNCDPAGELEPNAECGYINDCLPGHLCLDASALPNCAGAACCSPWCDLSNPTCAEPGTECVAFYDEGTAPPNLVDVGICAIPGA
jgi:hypothetical protein